MSKPKTYPPYKVMTAYGYEWIVDANECDVITSVGLSYHYADILEPTIMQLICDKLNEGKNHE